MGELFVSQSPAESASKPLVSLVDLQIIEVSEFYVGLDGSTQLSPDRSFKGQPWPKAAGDLPAAERVGWRLPPPKWAVNHGDFVFEALVVVGEVSILCSGS